MKSCNKWEKAPSKPTGLGTRVIEGDTNILSRARAHTGLDGHWGGVTL